MNVSRGPGELCGSVLGRYLATAVFFIYLCLSCRQWLGLHADVWLLAQWLLLLCRTASPMFHPNWNFIRTSHTRRARSGRDYYHICARCHCVDSFDILYFVVAWGIIIALIYYFRENIILFLLGASLLVIGILLFLIVGVLYTIPLGCINEKVKNEKKKCIFLIIGCCTKTDILKTYAKCILFNHRLIY